MVEYICNPSMEAEAGGLYIRGQPKLHRKSSLDYISSPCLNKEEMRGEGRRERGTERGREGEREVGREGGRNSPHMFTQLQFWSIINHYHYDTEVIIQVLLTKVKYLLLLLQIMFY
jgi:hypothetical protein